VTVTFTATVTLTPSHRSTHRLRLGQQARRRARDLAPRRARRGAASARAGGPGMPGLAPAQRRRPGIVKVSEIRLAQ
jgi:hypothetical protein